MSYYAILDYDESLGGDVASNQGWSDFVKFVDRFVVPGDSTIHDLTRMGVCDDVDTLRLELQEYTGQDPTVDELLRIVPADVPSDAVLVVTDGAGLGDDGVEREYAITVGKLVQLSKNLSKETRNMERIMNDTMRERKAQALIENIFCKTGPGGLTVKPQRVVTNAFPPAAGGAPAGGATRPKLDMPLLPENLRIADGEGDPNAVEVSRDDLLKIKEVIDRLLTESDPQQQQSQDGSQLADPNQQPPEDQQSPEDQQTQNPFQKKAVSTDAVPQDGTDPNSSIEKSQDDITRAGVVKPQTTQPQTTQQPVPDQEEPFKPKRKGFFNAK